MDRAVGLLEQGRSRARTHARTPTGSMAVGGTWTDSCRTGRSESWIRPLACGSLVERRLARVLRTWGGTVGAGHRGLRNRRCPHSTTSLLTPVEFENRPPIADRPENQEHGSITPSTKHVWWAGRARHRPPRADRLTHGQPGTTEVASPPHGGWRQRRFVTGTDTVGEERVFRGGAPALRLQPPRALTGRAAPAHIAQAAFTGSSGGGRFPPGTVKDIAAGLQPLRCSSQRMFEDGPADRTSDSAYAFP